LADLLNFFRVLKFFESDHLLIAATVEVALFVEDVSNPAGHACGEVTAGRAEDHDAAAGHVFAAMIANGFDDGVDAAVSDAKAFARHAANVDFAAGSAVQRDVAND